MATQARGASNKAKNQMMAQRMKNLGIRRTHGLCPVCYRIVSVPMGSHFFGGNCS